MNAVFLLVGIAVLGLIILIHELGHFVFCKFFGVKVLKFSVGFGPALLRRKIGETEFLVSAIPFGGYISPLDEEKIREINRVKEELIRELQSKGAYELTAISNQIDRIIEEKFGVSPDDIKSRTFENKSYGAKVLMVLGGPLFNILASVVAMYVMLTLGIEKIGNTVGDVMKNSPAERAGIMRGDIVKEVNGVKVETWDEIKANIMISRDLVRLRVVRDGSELYFEILPISSERGGKMIGIYPDVNNVVKIRYDPGEAVYRSLVETYKFLTLFIRSLGMLFSREGLETLGGPISLTRMTSEAAQSGLKTALMVVFIISINLGILNLLPIPILDGGHILLLTVEKILGRRFSVHLRQVVNIIGLFVLSLLLVIATFNDIKNMFAKKLF